MSHERVANFFLQEIYRRRLQERPVLQEGLPTKEAHQPSEGLRHWPLSPGRRLKRLELNSLRTYLTRPFPDCTTFFSFRWLLILGHTSWLYLLRQTFFLTRLCWLSNVDTMSEGVLHMASRGHPSWVLLLHTAFFGHGIDWDRLRDTGYDTMYP